MQRSALALGAVVLALTACGTYRDTGAQRPAPTGTSTPAPTPAQATPLVVAAVLGDGRAVTLDADTGEVRRVLVEQLPVDDPAANDIAVAPDGAAVYVVRPGQRGGDSEILEVDPDAGGPEVLVQGQSPAVSPDGGTLAYVRFEDEQPAGQTPTLRFRDLATGDERVLAEGGAGFYGLWDLAWTADGSSVVFAAGEIKLGVHVVPRDADSLADARRLGPADTGPSWSDVAVLDARTVAVVEQCCRLPGPEPERWRVVAVDVRTGEVTGEALPGRVEAHAIDGRYGERSLLTVSLDGPEGGSLLRWDGEGRPRELASDVVAAAW